MFRQWLESFNKKWRARPLHSRAQAFIEFALVLPILLIMLLGVVEVSFYVARYLDLLDLTREAARFASVRDPFFPAQDQNCTTVDMFDFYYDTSCIFSPPFGSALCTDANFCFGLNSNAPLNMATDDVVVTVFTITNNVVTNTWPAAGYWALSNADGDTTHNDNFKTDCDGNIIRDQPFFTGATVDSHLQAASTPNKGMAAVEAYYCYSMALNIPFASQFLPPKVRMHAYTIMSVPASQPSATPRP